ncbi:MAG: FAD-binding oxidoreductase [Hyphomicrobiales bacterium]|jgi:D-amino-acid dehydrogenase
MGDQVIFDQCVIGAGIIGLAIAFKLTQAGQKVLILDRDGMGEGASRGNAGAFAFADVEPMASPATLLKSPRWLLDPLGPLSVPLSYAPKMAPWMAQFARACLPTAHAASTKAQAALMELSKAETEPMFAAAGLSSHLRHEGALYLYAGQRAFDAAADVWRVRAEHGVAFEPVTGARLAELQPGLGSRYTHAMFVPDWMTVSDPFEITKALGEQAVSEGATFRQAKVSHLQPGEDITTITLEGGQTITARQTVVASGAWSGELAALLGDTIPLEAERGYNTTLAADAFDLKRQLVVPADGYVITPLANGIRVGGAAEFAGFKRPPDYRRSAMMLKKSESVMLGLKTAGGKQWMGFRPSLPDTLPVISRSTASPQVMYAFGHGHLGLTQCAATAVLVRDLALGTQSSIDVHPYRAQRFC